MEDHMASIKEKYALTHLSIYFRDLNNGEWVGLEEKEYFSPSSMLKTPVLVALFKYAQYDQSILDKVITLKEEDFQNVSLQYTPGEKVLLAGEQYTMLDLAKIMIKESNNVAARVVRINIPDKYFEKTFAQVGVSFFSKEEDFLIRVKDMAGFWRVLFNASYLSREYSEEVLKILSETSYDNGIVAGVPKNIVVAHKFGERVAEGLLLENEIFGINDVQVHDCGIVYFPGKPYIMCVMTRGTSFKNQEKAIAEVSAYFYKEVDKALAHKK
jgi:beta-lactamase class A